MSPRAPGRPNYGLRRAVVGAIALALVAGVALAVSSVTGGGGSDESAVSAPSSAPMTTSTSTLGERGARGNGNPVTFAFAGDVHFTDQLDTDPGAVSGSVPLATQLRNDPEHVLSAIAPTLAAADVTVVNLETALTERGEPVPGKNYHFRSPATSLKALESAGVDVVNMANNHALDYGTVGMQDTFDAIAKAKIPVIGIGRNATEAYRPARVDVKGQRVAIFSATDWVEPALVDGWSATETQPGLAFSIDRTRLVAAIRAERPKVDTLVAFMHWGTEETYCASSEQGDLARTLLDAGADIVVGSHAHRVFGAGRVGPSLVAYGLGNFVYWREDGESGRSGVLLVTATGREVDEYSWVPARITNGLPVPQSGAAAAADVAEWERRRTCSGLAP